MNSASVSDTARLSPWFTIHTPRPHALHRIYGFHHAGGNAAVFRDWGKHLPDDVELAAAMLPGRGSRASERLVTHLPELIAELGPAIQKHGARPFVMFGHSMGALIAFELCRWLRRFGFAPPRHLYLAGLPAPSHLAKARSQPARELSDDELIGNLKRLEGLPAEILAEPEVLKLALPIFRADLELVQRYHCEPEQPLDVPITVLGGLADLVTSEALRDWRQHTTAAFRARMFEGNHFFVPPNLPAIAALTAKPLRAAPRPHLGSTV